MARRLLLPCCLALWALSSAAQAETPHEGAELEELSLEQLLDVEVTTATKSSQALREAPAVISVISAKQLRERGYQSVGEALSSLPGLDLLHDHFQYNLGVRGVSPGAHAWSRSVKVMIDGQPVSYRPSQEVWLGEELIPLEVVERIEVIKGPASVLYGANAYLGVINIITKSGEQVQLGQASVNHGFSERLVDPGGSLLLGGAQGGFDVVGAARVQSTARAGYQLRNLPAQNHPLEDERSRSGQPISASGFARLSYSSARVGRILLDFNYQQLERYTEFMDWGVMAHANLQSLYNLYGRVRYERSFRRRIDWSIGVATAGGAPRKRDRLAVAPDLDYHVERKVGYRGYDVFSDLGVRLDDLGKVTLTADCTLDDQKLLNYYTVAADGSSSLNPPGTTLTGRRTFSNVGAALHGALYPFARTRVAALKPLSTVLGVRYDHHNIYGDKLNYSAGLVHSWERWLYVKLLYGTSFRAPSSNQLYSNYIDTGGVIGNPKLKPESARTLELALGSAPIKYLNLELTAFLTRIRSKVETRPQAMATSANSAPQNLATIDSAGLEAAVSFNLEDFSSYANYAFQRSRASQPWPFSTDPDATVQTETLLYPSHTFKFGLHYKVPRAYLQANLEGRYTSARLGSESNNAIVNGVLGVASEQYALHPYFLLDLYISSLNLRLWKDRETLLSAKVTNLLGSNYTLPGYGGFDIPGFVRSFYITLSQQF
jgi:iron complex outermembrane receptor protein